MDERPRDGNGRFIYTGDSAARDADACRLRARHHTYQQIADLLGYGHKSEAYRGVQRALKDTVQEPADEVRALELDRLDQLARAATDVLERQHVTVSHGQIVRQDGEPLLDDGPVLAAIDRLLKIQERRAKLLGLNAPSRVSVDAEQLGAEILNLIDRAAQDSGDDDGT
ncbi:hypothetical protein LHJ74_14685 [Streptomyces sp. N2-109]|uniref:Terminase small subunit n=1 Tax=Streptomyces gossypii TaxID=2883101 RepID=A0ABT2JTW0_9ACTN|nr:hypothetical protein [Streptomyces gossypii]MCT2591138.1 hypothetical protein [Streptomyces gossypii]